MAIPALINGVLPPGTYPATINEIWATFDQARSMTRPALNLVLQHASGRKIRQHSSMSMVATSPVKLIQKM